MRGSYYYNDYTPRVETEVYQLRKEGKIEEAYNVALKLYNAHPNSDDVKKAYAWTVIDLCKKEHSAGNDHSAQQWLSALLQIKFKVRDEFTETICKQIKLLEIKLDKYSSEVKRAYDLSKDGNNDQAYKILQSLASKGNLAVCNHENYGWVIYKYLKDHVQEFNSIQVRSLLRDYIVLKNDRPSNLHSQFLNFSLNYSKSDSEFKLIQFLKLWNPRHLRLTDFEDSTAQDGKRIPSMMSRIAKEVVKYPKETVIEFVELIPKQAEFIEMLRNSCFWNIYNALNENRDNDAWKLFDAYNEIYPQYGKSEMHSKVLALAERSMKDGNEYRFFNFFKNWGPASLRDEDWVGQCGENGETYKPLALKSIKKAYDVISSSGSISSGDFSWLIDIYRDAVSRFRNDEWTERTLAQLLYRAEMVEEASDMYKKLSVKLNDKYYIWHEFANCVTNLNIRIGMLCKAISLEKNEDFMGKIRLDLAEQLLKAGIKDAAALEIKLHKEHYYSKGWNIKPIVESLEAACGQVENTKANNNDLYAEYIPYAEEYAYCDIPYTNLVKMDEWKNEEGKKLQKYVDGKNTEIVLNINKFPQLRNSRKGEIWSFKLYHQAIGKSTPLVVKQSNEADWSVLPLQYGYVNHVNEDKKVYHIYTQTSQLIYEHYENKKFTKGDFVSFRCYSSGIGVQKKLNIYSIDRCDSELTIPNFLSTVAAVDGVNEEKKLFHYVLGPGMLSGIVRYDQTEVRPSVGECVRIYYYIRTKKDDKEFGAEKKIMEVLKVEKTEETNRDAIRGFSGLLSVKYHGGDPMWFYDDEEEEASIPDFAFVEKQYIHRDLLEQYKITKNCLVEGKAVYSGDVKWKAFWLNIK